MSLLLRRAASEGVAPVADDKVGSDVRRAKGVRKILVVDDDDDVRTFIATALEEFGYEIEQAGDGAAAIGIFADQRPDLVVLDYVMPGMTGAEVAERLRADTPDQPILFVTGYSESDAITRAAPDAQVLTKPFLPDALDRAVHNALNGGKKRAIAR